MQEHYIQRHLFHRLSDEIKPFYECRNAEYLDTQQIIVLCI
jgi:hypothetical protein